MTSTEKPEVEFQEGPAPSELVIADIIVGDGDEAKPSDVVDVHYVGVDFESGEEFDSSWDRGQSANFPLDRLIPGWQEGIPGMKVGGRRKLTIPPELGYGAQASGPIPANSTLVFVVAALVAAYVAAQAVVLLRRSQEALVPSAPTPEPVAP